jgi:hypothetical protein
MTPTPRHTPGPWWFELHFVAAADPEGGQRVAYIADTVLFDVEARIASLETRNANRRLIAAAPDLFTIVYGLAYSGAPVMQMVDDARALVEKICSERGGFSPPDGTPHVDEEPAGPTTPQRSEHEEGDSAGEDEEHLPVEVQSDPELWFDICNDPSIWPENRVAAYRAALRGEREWWFATADESDAVEVTDAKPVGRNSGSSYLRRVK